MRRLRVGLAVLIILIQVVLARPVLGAGPAARLAQPDTGISLTLVSQSTWNGPNRPLRLTVLATNQSSTTYGDLAVELTIQAAARSRSVYDLSLRADATDTLFAYPFQEPGTIRPGGTRSFRISQALGVLAARGESVVYPLKVELRSGDLSLATLRTPMVFLIEHPEAPLNLQWTWVLSEPIQFGPDGTFVAGSLESDVASGGRLRVMATVLDSLGPTQVDVVVSAALADQLQRMARGYRIEGSSSPAARTVLPGEGGAADAAAVLNALRDVARSRGTELLGSPLGEASLPALFGSGLEADVQPLIDRGATILESAVGRPPDSDVARAPLGQLDTATLRTLVDRGARTILFDPNFIPVSNPYNAPPVVRLPGLGTGAAITGVVPDPQVGAIATQYRGDPTLEAHAALGELAAIWLELPGTSGRGAAVFLSSGSPLPSAYFGQFASLVRSSPWLTPVTGAEFTSVVPVTQRRALPSRDYPDLAPLYIDQLLRAKATLSHFRQTVAGVDSLAATLRTNLYLAESGAFVLDPSLGYRFIASVRPAVEGVYRQIHIATSVVTLTSQRGYIPLTFQNTSGHVVRVVVKFEADRRLRFPGGSTQHVTLATRVRTLTFPVRALVHGRVPFTVVIQTRGGDRAPETIAERELIIRSTAYNRLALFITIGAALFLLGWWGRRFLPRRRS